MSLTGCRGGSGFRISVCWVTPVADTNKFEEEKEMTETRKRARKNLNRFISGS
jgi:hypothetical protein